MLFYSKTGLRSIGSSNATYRTPTYDAEWFEKKECVDERFTKQEKTRSGKDALDISRKEE